MTSYKQGDVEVIREVHELEAEVKRIKFKWSVGYATCGNEAFLICDSPSFGGGSNPSFSMNLNPEKGKYYSIHLIPMIGSSWLISGKFTISLLDAKGKTVITKSHPTVNFDDCYGAGIPKFAKKSLIMRHAANMTIVCDLHYTVNHFDFPDEKHVAQKKEVQKELHQNFHSLFESSKFSDVVLCVAGIEFKAHKAVLAARSEVFAAMFKHVMIESQRNYVEITDISPEVFKALLDYIYSGSTANVDEIAAELMAAADKYLLNHLKQVCEEKLCQSLCVETSVQTLVAADLYSCKDLKERAIKFIISNAAAIVEREDWNHLQTFYPHLVKEMQSSKKNKSKSNKLFKNIIES